MRVSILLQITDDHGVAGASEEVAAFEKATERPEDLGLLMAEGKTLLAAIQSKTVTAQVSAWSERHRGCEVCGERRRVKGSYPIQFHTLYGHVELHSPRLHRCPCQGSDGPATVSPLRDLLPDHVAPERLYLEARWASLVSYAAAADLLADVLPITAGANATTLREHVMGVDGGYVRKWTDRKTNFELIVGRSIPEDREPRYFGLAHGYDRKPKRRLFDMLKSQGLQANQDVTFLTDGGDEVRALTEFVTPAGEHVPDWFHITMRITVLTQFIRGVAHHDEAKSAELLKSLERIKWLLWHGNLQRALTVIGDFEEDVDELDVDYPNLRKFARTTHEFAVYISSNTASLINYGERYRAGERISSCLAESTVNPVISKRFAKRQQMQWTPRGAHLLLQTRTRALDGTLRPLFERWHPGLAANDDAREPMRAAA